ncbi:MAG: hypothetical protein JSS43_00835 [Proteobacteria bacterium]|nr:hypothetical protein [Pseudomonadota bacterium]
MPLSQRVKTALDETRTLILGAQILLGFQYQSVFRPRFDVVSPAGRATNAAALCLMLITLALLVAPSAYHRISENGLATGAMQSVTGRCAEAALLPFAAALGMDLGLAGSWAFRSVWAGALTGAGFAVAALASWVGMGTIMKRSYGAAERRKAASERDRQETGPLHGRIEQLLTEARVILPGAQALLGFQLVIVLTSVFEKLPDLSKTLHGLSLLCVALAVVMLVTPAAVHRIVWSGEDSETFLRVGGRIIVAALLPLALGMAGETYVVFTRIFNATGAGLGAGAGSLACLLGCWLVWPFTARWRRARARRMEHRQRVA